MMKHQPFTILLHIALIIILAGAIVTHFFGIQGTLTLNTSDTSVSRFEQTSVPGSGEFPFTVTLKSVDVIYYPGTTTPMDFRSEIEINGRQISVAMNQVGEYEGWRFYQSGIRPDSSIFSISYDPWGIGLTYTGYALLGIGMIGFFIQKRTVWHSLIRKYRKVPAILFLMLTVTQAGATSAQRGVETRLPVMQRPLAANLGKVPVYWNDRICPMQTMAYDISSALYGRETYNGLTPEQILSGWLFYYDQWQQDYLQTHPELRTAPTYPATKAEKKLAQQLALIEWIGTGEIFRIYPYQTVDGHIEWLSLTGKRPSGMELEQWVFMQTSMPAIKELLLRGKNIEANERLNILRQVQARYATGIELPSETKINAERIYNKAVRPAFAGILAMVIGLPVLILSVFRPHVRLLRISSMTASIILLLYVSVCMGLLWWLSGHIPLSNGPETMMFMAFASLAGACLSRNITLRGGLLVVAAMSLFVTAMGGRTPRIGAMMPVLSSPLLSVHVMVVMISYAIFLLIAILSGLALMTRDKVRMHQLTLLNRIMLTPAICLLGAGIFIGAVWANQTWGRYWGWDPKETSALVMWLVYAIPVHCGNRHLAVLRKERVLNVYLLLAILSVIFTYFGANYLLSGLHSYA